MRHPLLEYGLYGIIRFFIPGLPPAVVVIFTAHLVRDFSHEVVTLKTATQANAGPVIDTYFIGML